jgi:adenylate cyclase
MSPAVSIAARYAAGRTLSHLLTTAEAIAIMVSLCTKTLPQARSLLSHDNLILLIVVVVVGTAVTAIAAYTGIIDTARWYAMGQVPDEAQRKAAIGIVRGQSIRVMSVWLLSGAVLIVANPQTFLALLVGSAAVLGGLSTVSTSLLFTQRLYRPLVAAATQDYQSRTTAPGVLARLVAMWVINSALPSAVIAVLVLCHHFGWFITTTASVDIPVVVLAVVSVALGLRSLIVVSLSISDPVHDVVEAMAEVERGIIGRTVPVYEQSEIGRLQSGFNRMVAGLVERDRLRELFGRHVGLDVARLAIASDTTGDVRDVAILFIDLVESTQLATRLRPQEVAAVFNDFFRIVVTAVDKHGGLINKFQGDAALAIYGAPLDSASAADDALATARALAESLRALPMIDFGIGISAGSVFAGNIGAENRYEYTVIGDPVNEAARLADEAKEEPARTLASSAALECAQESECRHWQSAGLRMLRGRTKLTHVSIPILEDGSL